MPPGGSQTCSGSVFMLRIHTGYFIVYQKFSAKHVSIPTVKVLSEGRSFCVEAIINAQVNCFLRRLRTCTNYTPYMCFSVAIVIMLYTKQAAPAAAETERRRFEAHARHLAA